MITGWRAFSVCKDADDKIVLQGIWSDWIQRELTAECWIPGRALHSQCWRDDEGRISLPLVNEYLSDTRKRAEKHLLAPQTNCGCGIYAARNVLSLQAERTGSIYASTTLWGAIRPYEEGWRVQHARIESLWLDFDTCRRECTDYIAWNSSAEVPTIVLQCVHIFDKINPSARKNYVASIIPAKSLIDALKNRYEVPVKAGMPPLSEEETNEYRKAQGEALRRTGPHRGPRIFSSNGGSRRSWGIYAHNFAITGHADSNDNYGQIGVSITWPVSKRKKNLKAIRVKEAPDD
ncbi:hypothetical protein LCGC14_0288990 [marine sediment metagenome]|uniref:Uncharacterized protein n=1 Tax=marine sediment metagenome TaxID=412755 RepID=A0A0F9UAQ5_9ZZZZ